MSGRFDTRGVPKFFQDFLPKLEMEDLYIKGRFCRKKALSLLLKQIKQKITDNEGVDIQLFFSFGKTEIQLWLHNITDEAIILTPYVRF